MTSKLKPTARTKYELVSQSELDALDEWVQLVLKAFGHEEALATDESLVSDFLERGGEPHHFRRGWKGPWVEHPGDPAVRKRNAESLASASAKLGVLLGPQDRIVDVARLVR
jgi:hypothetical protein